MSTRSYVLALDSDSIFELTPNDDACSALAILARDAGATFTNLRVVPSRETIFFAAIVSVAFDATPSDVASYARFYDCDDDTIQPYDA